MPETPHSGVAGQTGSPRRKVRRSAVAVFIITCVIIVCAGAELGATLVFKWKRREYESLRRVLSGDAAVAISNAKIMPHPFLQYVPSPNYRDSFGVQHNQQGYRGKATTPERRPGVARVLCLGGSTTYGWTVDKPEESYPARMEELLRQRKPADVVDVEVINGGLPLGTSAESLTHYQFKYHYYHPDVIVLEAGGNDALGYELPNYQPDYGHWRNAMRAVQPLPRYSRWLMHSRAVALVTIALFRRDEVDSQQIIRHAGNALPGVWYEGPGSTGPNSPSTEIPDQYLAYRHNVSVAVDLMKLDGCRVILLAFRPNPAMPYPGIVQDGFARHETTMESLSKEKDVPFLRFPAEVISKENWTDNAHLNAAGELEKARYVVDQVADLLWPKNTN